MPDKNLVPLDKELGPVRRWSLDLALLGAASSFLAPAAIFALFGLGRLSGFIPWATALGALSGALLGPGLRRLFGGPLRRAKVLPLLAGGLGVGAVWGALVSAGAASLVAPNLLPWALGLGAIAGAIQLGWFWLPYLLRRARGRSTWPVLVAASMLSPALGFAGFYGFVGLTVLFRMIY